MKLQMGVLLLLIAALGIAGCKRYSPEGLNRLYYELGYAGKSPEKLKDYVLSADNIDEVIGPLIAMSEIDLHYSGEDSYHRFLSCMKRIHEKSRTEWGEQSIDDEFMTGRYDSFGMFKKFTPKTIGELTHFAVLHSVFALEENYRKKNDQVFTDACVDFLQEIEPTEHPVLHEYWQREMKLVEGQ